MSTRLGVFLAILMGAVLIGLVLIRWNGPSKTVVTFQEPARASAVAPAPQQKTLGVVDIEVTPRLWQGNRQPAFEIALNTHSVELEYNLTEIIKLTDNLGNTYEPLEWNGGSGGHHLRGEMTFERVRGDPSSLTLTISGIDGQTESFTWDRTELKES